MTRVLATGAVPRKTRIGWRTQDLGEGGQSRPQEPPTTALMQGSILALGLLSAPLLGQGAHCHEWDLRALDGQSAPEGGILALTALEGQTLGVGGRTAFRSFIAGPARNQALLISDGDELRTIAFGCGGQAGSGAFGSCGDPAPGGGTFGGFFDAHVTPPALDRAGDLLFLADLVGAGSPRGLFLHRAASATTEVVARVGQVLPNGRTILALGTGSTNGAGDAVFLTCTSPGLVLATEVVRYSGGLLEIVAERGGPGPFGQNYELFSRQTALLPDGTLLPRQPLPAIDSAGRVAFWGATSGAIEFLALATPGASVSVIVGQNEPTPAGGNFWRLDAPLFAPDGEIVFSAMYLINTFPSGPSGWFSTSPTGIRHRFSTGTPSGDTHVAFLGRSWNPMAPFGADGEWILHATLAGPGVPLPEALLAVAPDGSHRVLVRTGDPAPGGGAVDRLFEHPCADAQGRVAISATLTGTLAGSAHWLHLPCGVPTAYCRAKANSHGTLPRIDSLGHARAGGADPFTVTAASVPSGQPAVLFYGFAAASTPFLGGLRCVAAPLRRSTVQVSSGGLPSHGAGTLTFDFAARIRAGVDPALVAGAAVHAQWFVRDPGDVHGAALTDALRFVITP